MKRKGKQIKKIDHVKMYKSVFEEGDGPAVLADMAKKYHVFSPTIVAGMPEYNFYYMEGQRNVVLSILKMLDYDLNALMQHRDQNQMEVIND